MLNKFEIVSPSAGSVDDMNDGDAGCILLAYLVS